MKSLQDFLRLALAVLVVGLTVGYALAAWQLPQQGPPAGPGGYNADAPINVSNTAQTKDGSLTISDNLFSSKILAINKLGVGFTDANQLDATAVLDVNGPIRLRSGCASGDCTNKVLTSFNPDGLASWQIPTAGLVRLAEGFGVDFCDYGHPITPGTNCSRSEITEEGVIAVAAGQLGTALPATIQQRLTSDCLLPSGRAMTKIDSSGNPTCSSFVTTVQAPANSGLTLLSGLPLAAATTAVSGAITLKIYTGAPSDNTGLKINASNQVALNVNETAGAGDGLTVSGGLVKFESCAANQTWKYDGTKWGCADFVFAQPLGESVMYLRSPSSGTPPSCPALPSPGWTQVTSSLAWTGNESVGHATVYNKMRACYRNDKACQVIYFRSTSATSPAPANCPGSWTQAANSSEYAPGGAYTNYVRTCYLCN